MFCDRKYRMIKKIYVYNSFTENSFEGNPAGVVPESDGLDNLTMQKIAKQLNLVETVFILKPQNPDSYCSLRYFTPKKELPIAGHPTIAAWRYLLENDNNLSSTKQPYRQDTQIGQINIAIEGNKIFTSQQTPTIELVSKEIVEDNLDVLNLHKSDIASQYPFAVVNAGLGHLIFGVQSLEALMKASFEPDKLSTLCQKVGAKECQIFCLETYQQNRDAHIRNLCPRYGLEDPACGNGNAALGAYFHHFIHPTEKKLHLRFEQGRKIDMPAIIEVIAHKNDNQIDVMVGGHAKKMIEGNIYL